MSDLETTAPSTAAAFPTVVQADIRRERRLLYAEIVILALLVGLAVLRYWMAR